MHPQDFQFLAQFVRERAGIVLEEGKQYLLESRLAGLLRDESLTDIATLCKRLREPGSIALKSHVIEAMTTNETSFFRDGSPFEVLRQEVFPELIKQRQLARRLSIWSAASSSGQEPYTVAMILRDTFPQIATWDVKITATDLSQQMVDRTAAGVFSDYELSRGMPTGMRERHFHRTGTSWTARDELRSMIHAQQLNLIQPFPVDFKFDLVLIRNVLIYFDEPTKESILRRVHRTLASDGYMMLGTAETPRGDCFDRAGQASNLFRPAA